MLYFNRTTGTVGAKLSSGPDPQDPNKLVSTLPTVNATAAALA
jgi:hypothetical protein